VAVILFVDLLGARSRWQRGGIDTALTAFDHFTRFMIAAAKPDLTAVVDGAIETDAAAFVCSDLNFALSIAQRAFMRAFDTPKGDQTERLWIRGAIVPAGEGALRTERSAYGDAGNVKIFTYSREFFDAVSVEKSGFRGMRLLVRGSLLTPSARKTIAIPVGNRFLVPVKRLRHSTYPRGPAEDLQDFLWMASSEPADWERAQRRMSSRFRDSTGDQEEFAQAAATQVLFHEATAIFQSVHFKANRPQPAC
jgi:hypothetical protein